MVEAVDDWLKQRLVGAVVLVALGVIFIPMLIEPPEPEPEVAGRLYDPVTPEVDFLESPEITEVTIPLPEEPPTVVDTGLAPIEPRPTEVVAEPAPVKVETANKPAPVEAKASQGDSLTAWVVQVGSFKQQQNALALRDKIRKRGFTAFVERIKSASGATYRVRVGPEMSYTRIKQRRDALKSKLSLKGVIMKHR